MASHPPKWHQVYPQGTSAGDEELRFFKAIARHPSYHWRGVAAIAAEARLSKERVEQIIKKYLKHNMIFQNPKNEEQWGYWENHPKLVPKTSVSVADKDTKSRLNKAMGVPDPAATPPLKKKKTTKAP